MLMLTIIINYLQLPGCARSEPGGAALENVRTLCQRQLRHGRRTHIRRTTLQRARQGKR